MAVVSDSSHFLLTSRFNPDNRGKGLFLASHNALEKGTSKKKKASSVTQQHAEQTSSFTADMVEKGSLYNQKKQWYLHLNTHLQKLYVL